MNIQKTSNAFKRSSIDSSEERAKTPKTFQTNNFRSKVR